MDKRPDQFVIQRHTAADGMHWDLMLEAQQVLWTWRIPVPPEQMGQQPVLAERIADHSPRFLTYEGPVQKNTGQVQIADSGTMFMQRAGEDHLVLKLHGKILSGLYELIHQERNEWILRRTAPPESP